MALLASELERVKAELGYNVLTIGALPYVGHSQLFDDVVLPYLSAGATTSSSTTVTAASSVTPVTLTLASATGFAVGAHVAIDVDDLQEIATVRNVSGSTISVALTLAHSGTYPVTVDGGEMIVRQLLKRLATLASRIDGAAKVAGLKRAEDLEWYPNATFKGLADQRMNARDELADALGVPNLRRRQQASSQRIAPY